MQPLLLLLLSTAVIILAVVTPRKFQSGGHYNYFSLDDAKLIKAHNEESIPSAESLGLPSNSRLNVLPIECKFPPPEKPFHVQMYWYEGQEGPRFIRVSEKEAFKHFQDSATGKLLENESVTERFLKLMTNNHCHTPEGLY